MLRVIYAIPVFELSLIFLQYSAIIINDIKLAETR